MRPELETYRLIDRYLSGELKGEELVSFETKMQSETDFVQEIELQKLTNSVVAGAAYDKLREQMKSDIRALDAKKAASKSIWKRVLAGSSLVISAGIGYYFYTSSENVLGKTQNVDIQSDKSIKETYEVTPKREILEAKPEAKLIEKRSQIPVRKIDLKEEVSHPAIAKIQEPEVLEPVEIVKAPSNLPVVRHEASIVSQKPLQAPVHESPKKEERIPKEVAIAKEPEVVEKESTHPNSHTVHSSSGETWRIPVDAGKEYTLHIYNSAGVSVFKHNSVNNHLSEWDGSSSNGTLLEAGIYVYIIEFVNGTKETGQITIVK